ncbi:DNA-directed RNA polymerase III complex subunit Rpc53 (predicted) [Phytophthora palmivora]|uniref:DNA-directed RNA polymerase III complex subunit Rpc53 (Predicted) n=1 Tax=Phytophthora palmivora TaxID=4796 RepID=A0A2P4XNH3_9STRA|nr:DNA-directed RNA polymerase III complex subunit Rpc53 (predicted) [Phytophthora palmivora]
MAGKQTSGVRPRVDASSARLTSLRTSTDTATAPARRPKFVPKAAKRRPAVEGRGEGVDTGPQRSHDAKPHSTGAGALKSDNRGRGDFGRRGGRGGRGGRGRGRGRGMLPSGKVAFVGTLSGGSSYSGGNSAPAPRATPSADYSAAGGTGISVLDDEEMPGGQMPEMKVEEVWPPVVKSVMEPMSLPIVRPPEPDSAGAVFCDAAGDLVTPDDSLFFIQMPTTLPLSSVVTKTVSTDEDESMESTNEVKDQEAKKAKENKNPDESPYVHARDDGVFDHSIESAPGGFIGKICVHKSGKMVLMLGDKQFEVAAAQTPSFCEEVYAVNMTEKHLSILGNVERHLVVTPDFDVLLH